jgi:hypothetical protein
VFSVCSIVFTAQSTTTHAITTEAVISSKVATDASITISLLSLLLVTAKIQFKRYSDLVVNPNQKVFKRMGFFDLA